MHLLAGLVALWVLSRAGLRLFDIGIMNFGWFDHNGEIDLLALQKSVENLLVLSEVLVVVFLALCVALVAISLRSWERSKPFAWLALAIVSPASLSLVFYKVAPLVGMSASVNRYRHIDAMVDIALATVVPLFFVWKAIGRTRTSTESFDVTQSSSEFNVGFIKFILAVQSLLLLVHLGAAIAVSDLVCSIVSRSYSLSWKGVLTEDLAVLNLMGTLRFVVALGISALVLYLGVTRKVTRDWLVWLAVGAIAGFVWNEQIVWGLAKVFDFHLPYYLEIGLGLTFGVAITAWTLRSVTTHPTEVTASA